MKLCRFVRTYRVMVRGTADNPQPSLLKRIDEDVKKTLCLGAGNHLYEYEVTKVQPDRRNDKVPTSALRKAKRGSA